MLLLLLFLFGYVSANYIVMFKETLRDGDHLFIREHASVLSISDLGTSPTLIVTTDENAELLSFLEEKAYDYILEHDELMHHDVALPWGIDRLDQQNLPLDDVYNPPNDGSGVHIYIVDSGVNINHNAFAGRITRDYVIPGEAPEPCDFHGSWTAAIAGGDGLGVAQNAILHDIHVSRDSLDCAFYTSDALSALSYISANGLSPMVINLSFQGPQSQCMDVMLEQLRTQGAFIAAAAGNSGSSTLSCFRSPSSSPDVFSVGATTQSDWLATFSNRKDCVRIYAPGQDIPGASFDDNAGQVMASGTSASSPHVAGIGALAWADGAATVAEVENKVLFWANEGIVKGAFGYNTVFASLTGMEISSTVRLLSFSHFLLAL